MQTTTLSISGMSCGHCVKAVEDALKNVDGVEVDQVKIGKATIRYDESKVNREAVAAAVEEEGYTVET